MRELDPKWQPRPSVYSADVEGVIARNTFVAEEAQARMDELRRQRADFPGEPPQGTGSDTPPNRAKPLLRPHPTNDPFRGFDPSNLKDKLTYLLNPEHVDNERKADWFNRALGFNESNWRDLADQLYYDQNSAKYQFTTPWGDRYEQTISIRGVNAREIPVRFIFQEEPSGRVTFITAKPSKKP